MEAAWQCISNNSENALVFGVWNINRSYCQVPISTIKNKQTCTHSSLWLSRCNKCSRCWFSIAFKHCCCVESFVLLLLFARQHTELSITAEHCHQSPVKNTHIQIYPQKKFKDENTIKISSAFCCLKRTRVSESLGMRKILQCVSNYRRRQQHEWGPYQKFANKL